MSTIQQPKAPTPTAEPASDYETIRAIVVAWSPELRANLLHDLINTLVNEAREPDLMRAQASKLVGILDMGQPAPNDEEVETIIQENREAKYA